MYEPILFFSSEFSIFNTELVLKVGESAPRIVNQQYQSTTNPTTSPLVEIWEVRTWWSWARHLTGRIETSCWALEFARTHKPDRRFFCRILRIFGRNSRNDFLILSISYIVYTLRYLYHSKGFLKPLVNLHPPKRPPVFLNVQAGTLRHDHCRGTWSGATVQDIPKMVNG